MIDSAIDSNNSDQLPLSKAQYRLLFLECKRQAANAQWKCRYNEQYLGRNTLSNDLSHSLDEFINIILKNLGFCPYIG